MSPVSKITPQWASTQHSRNTQRGSLGFANSVTCKKNKQTKKPQRVKWSLQTKTFCAGDQWEFVQVRQLQSGYYGVVAHECDMAILWSRHKHRDPDTSRQSEEKASRLTPHTLSNQSHLQCVQKKIKGGKNRVSLFFFPQRTWSNSHTMRWQERTATGRSAGKDRRKKKTCTEQKIWGQLTREVKGHFPWRREGVRRGEGKADRSFRKARGFRKHVCATHPHRRGNTCWQRHTSRSPTVGSVHSERPLKLDVTGCGDILETRPENSSSSEKKKKKTQNRDRKSLTISNLHDIL